MIRIFFILVLMIIISSCKSKYEECTESDYQSCNTSRPETGMVNLQVSINSENPSVLVRMYEGNFEDGVLVWEKIFRSPDRNEFVDAEKDFSFTAEYTKGLEKILAIDGGKVAISSYQMCEYRCYEAKVLSIDLRIE